MAQYNLINTGFIISNTISGTGNVTLTDEELLSLHDGNTTSSGVNVTTSGILYLDVDIGYRVRMDEVNLYIDVPGDRATALNNVDFYYKNLPEDSFTLCSKDYDSTKFFPTNLPDLFAPQIVRVAITLQECTVNEFVLLNDDAQVSFGEDGNETLVILNQTLNGYDELGIFNNSPLGTQTVNAYVMVDYQGLESDYYLTLSDKKDGPYYGMNDGVDLKNNDSSQTYTWNIGDLDQLTTNAHDHLVNSNQNIGYYTTPLFDMADKFQNTFLMTERTLISGSNITWDENFPDGNIKIRSSDTYPLPFTKMIWAYRNSVNVAYLLVGDMATGYKDQVFKQIWDDQYYEPYKCIFDRKRSHIILLFYKTLDNPDTYRVRKYDYATKATLYSSSLSSQNKMTTYMDVDALGNVWGYVAQDGFRLVKFNYSLATRSTMELDDQNDFLGGLSANKEYASCWYTHTKQNKLYHIDADNNVIAAVAIDGPTKVAALPDGGCFVVAEGEAKIFRYSYYGNQLSTISYDSALKVNHLNFGAHSSLMPFDDDVLWMVLDNTRLLQIDFNGELISDTYVPAVSSIEACAGGCMVYASATSSAYQYNHKGELARTWSFSPYTKKARQPYPVVMHYEEFLTLPEVAAILPLDTDPYWGGDLNYKEIPTNGYMLPLNRYHQLKFKFTPHVVDVPIVNAGAETGNTSGWIHVDVNDNYASSSVTTIATDYVRTGTYAFNASLGDRLIRQRVSIDLPDVDLDLIDTGFMYKFRFFFYFYWMNTTSSYDRLRYWLQPVNANGDRFSYRREGYVTSLPTINNPTDAYWKEYVISEYVMEGTRAFDIWVGGYDYSNNSVMHIDDIQLQLIRSSSLNKVLIPKPVIIKDIKPQEFKNVYIKTDIPIEAQAKEYETRLKCWWGNEEE